MAEPTRRASDRAPNGSVPSLADPRTTASHLMDRLRHLPTGPTLAAAAISMLVVAAADLLTARELTLALFYVLAVLTASWVAGRRAGSVFALTAGVLGLAMSLAGSDPMPVGIAVWNATMRTAFYLLTAWLTAGLRSLVDYSIALSETDPLTGLLNRRRFYELVEGDLSRRRGDRRSTLVYLDLDHLKGVNDGLGHEAGDDLIRRFATICRGELRDADLMARIGGDEFAIFLPDCDADAGVAVAERLRRRLGDEGRDPAISASMGVAVSRPGEADAESLVRAADEAMYAAKTEARGSIRVAGDRR